MVKDDYLASAPGGSLRLKGVKDGGISKKKKKKAKAATDGEAKADVAEAEGKRNDAVDKDGVANEQGRTESPSGTEEADGGPHVYKTEAERRHEEMRRKRVCGRLRR